jgi:hypothetical protein
MTGYLYGGAGIGQFKTRHKAVGVAAVRGREESAYYAAHSEKTRLAFTSTALKWTQRVDVVPWEWCRHCGEPFYEQDAYADHHPCDDAPDVEDFA